MHICMPPLPEQDRIVATLEATERESDALIERYQRKLDLVQELKRSILYSAFTGELSTDPKATDSALEDSGV